MTLADLKPRQKAKIKKILGGQKVSQRLSDLGLVPGTLIEVDAKAPFRGPIKISVCGSKLALGRGIAQAVLVEII